MASFDVTSLFTNIPLDETIKITADQLFSNSNNFEGFSRDEFVKLLNLAVKNCHFIFNGKFYDQIDGVAMGSPLGPLLANIFLSFHETNWLKDCPFEFKPLYYRRYVDDSFIALNHVTIFYHFLKWKSSPFCAPIPRIVYKQKIWYTMIALHQAPCMLPLYH